MLHRSERILDNIPVGSLGIIAVDGCEAVSYTHLTLPTKLEV